MTAQEQETTTFDRTENECAHYRDAEEYLDHAEGVYAENGPCDRVDTLLRFAAVHAQLAQAADIDRGATASDRLASAVPDGGSSLTVAVAGGRR